jgi:hypothetical protein
MQRIDAETEGSAVTIVQRPARARAQVLDYGKQGSGTGCKSTGYVFDVANFRSDIQRGEFWSKARQKNMAMPTQISERRAVEVLLRAHIQV